MKQMIARVLIWIHVLYAVLCPLSGVTVPNTFTSGNKIYASEFNSDFDTLEAVDTRICDTVNAIATGTKLMSKILADTIDSNPYIDSISGNPRIDSITVTTGFRGRLTTGNGNINTGTGDILSDSTYARTIKVGGAFSTVSATIDGLVDAQRVTTSEDIVSNLGLSNNYGGLIISVNSSKLDSVKVTTGSGHDTLKIWSGGKLFKVQN